MNVIPGTMARLNAQLDHAKARRRSSPSATGTPIFTPDMGSFAWVVVDTIPERNSRLTVLWSTTTTSEHLRLVEKYLCKKIWIAANARGHQPEIRTWWSLTLASRRSWPHSFPQDPPFRRIPPGSSTWPPHSRSASRLTIPPCSVHPITTLIQQHPFSDHDFHLHPSQPSAQLDYTLHYMTQQPLSRHFFHSVCCLASFDSDLSLLQVL